MGRVLQPTEAVMRPDRRTGGGKSGLRNTPLRWRRPGSGKRGEVCRQNPQKTTRVRERYNIKRKKKVFPQGQRKLSSGLGARTGPEEEKRKARR